MQNIYEQAKSCAGLAPLPWQHGPGDVVLVWALGDLDSLSASATGQLGDLGQVATPSFCLGFPSYPLSI